MTDVDRLIKDAGGPRPGWQERIRELEAAPTSEEVEAMARELDHGIDEPYSGAVDRLMERGAAMLRSLSRQVAEWQAAWRGMHDRAERAEAALVEKDAEIARVLSDPMNVGWQRAQDAIKDRAAAVSQWKAAKAERDALRAEVAGLRKAIAIIRPYLPDADSLPNTPTGIRRAVEAADDALDGKAP